MTALIAEFDVVQRVVGLGRAARNSSGVRVRQPLSRLLVRTPDAASAGHVARHEAQILEELNVKAVEMLAPDAELVSYRIKAEPAPHRQAVRQARPCRP